MLEITIIIWVISILLLIFTSILGAYFPSIDWDFKKVIWILFGIVGIDMLLLWGIGIYWIIKYLIE